MSTETVQLDGLGAEGTVRIDEWGVPHITAESAHDVFMLQGYVAARNRLFQLDLWRRKGLGLLSEAFGPAFVERDAAARSFLYRGDMSEEWQAYGPGAEEAVTAFVEGVNAFIDGAAVGDETLPPEFGRLDYLPSRWDASDVVRIRAHGLFENARSEVARATTFRDHGADVEDLRRVRDPKRAVDIDDDVLTLLFDDALLGYERATSPVSLTDASVRERPLISIDGSNNWVLDGSRTQSGRPLLANDPHRVMSNPSLRTLVHLSCPEFDVIGAGEPMQPGVSIGHNERVAFGLTIFPTDQEDVYFYEVEDDRYKYRGEWTEFDEVVEQIPVRGDEPRDVRLRFTVHGPVTGLSSDGSRAAAVRAAWLGTGMVPYLGSLRYLRATSVADYRAALEYWGAPTTNHVYADVDGEIGWQTAGRIPRRAWDGLTPVVGDGRAEWSGWRQFTDLPSRQSPKRGWFATANQFNQLDGETVSAPLSYEWLAPFRQQRIEEVLGELSDATVEDMVRLQYDETSIPARMVTTVLAGWETPLRERFAGEDACLAFVDLLLGWDHRATLDSSAAGAFEAWFRGPLRQRLLHEETIRLGADPSIIGTVLNPAATEELTGDPRVDIAALNRVATDPGRVLDVLVETIRATVELLPNEPHHWQLGELQRTTFRHPMAVLEDTEAWDMSPIGRGGTPDTVNVMARNAAGDQTVGASVRVVMDVGHWDEARAVNAPGQSGVPGAKHYDDLVGRWVSGEMFPLVYSRRAVEEATDETWLLRPRAEQGEERA